MCSATYTHAHSHTLTLTHTLSLSFSLSLSLTHTHTRSSQLACAIYPVPSNTCMLLHNSLVVDTFTIVVGGGEEEDEDHMKLPPISVVSSCMHNETELLARYLSPSPSSLSPVISCHSIHPVSLRCKHNASETTWGRLQVCLMLNFSNLQNTSFL